MDLPAAAVARASPEGHRGSHVPRRQRAVLLAQRWLPPGPAARRFAPPVYRHGPGPRRPQRRIERWGGFGGCPEQSAPGQAPAAAAASEQGPRLERESARLLRTPQSAPMSLVQTPRPGRCGPARAPGRLRAKATRGPQPPPLIGSEAGPAALRRSAPAAARGGAGAAPYGRLGAVRTAELKVRAVRAVPAASQAPGMYLSDLHAFRKP